MTARTLKVVIAGQMAGSLTQGSSGQITFSYESGYSGPPLSIAKRITNQTYTDKQVRPFLFGLLPDDPRVRQSMGAKFQVSGNNPFDLLVHSGLDCPGAVQFCLEDDFATLADREGSLSPIDDEGIAERLKQGREQNAAAWTDVQEHWSLGGQQSKFALRLEDGGWHRCLGSAATTHIFKGGIGRLEAQALNEYVCMKLARACGLPVAEVSYQVFSGEPAIVVKRYDRRRTKGGAVIRLHQEDFCQALGVLPENKYTENGGPGAADILALLRDKATSQQDASALFIEMLFFNYLIAAPDAHAKNYSLLLGASGEAVLAPLYDVASLFPYVRPRDHRRCAMSIGGENRIGHVGAHAIERFAQANNLADLGLDSQVCCEIMASFAQTLPALLTEVFEESHALEGIEALRVRLEGPVRDLCASTLRML
ncbi:MAG: type II toxin-antitoxin system HipA family toxin [Raoultibacter sp.]